MLDREHIKMYETIGNEILQYFDAHMHGYPDVMTHVSWAKWSGKLVWWDREPVSEEELDSPDYSENCLKLLEKEDYCLARLEDEEGVTYTALLASNRRIL